MPFMCGQIIYFRGSLSLIFNNDLWCGWKELLRCRMSRYSILNFFLLSRVGNCISQPLSLKFLSSNIILFYFIPHRLIQFDPVYYNQRVTNEFSRKKFKIIHISFHLLCKCLCAMAAINRKEKNCWIKNEMHISDPVIIRVSRNNAVK